MFNDDPDMVNPEQSASKQSIENATNNDRDSQGSASGAERKSITLDEFLIMNKDVFGEGIDFQGIEEIPRQVVTNQLRRKPRPRKINPKTQSAKNLPHLEKLKKAGVVVKLNKKPQIRNSNKQVQKISPGTPLKIAEHLKDQLLSKLVPVAKNNQANKPTPQANKPTPQVRNQTVANRTQIANKGLQSTTPLFLANKSVTQPNKCVTNSIISAKPSNVSMPFNKTVVSANKPTAAALNTSTANTPLPNMNKMPMAGKSATAVCKPTPITSKATVFPSQTLVRSPAQSSVMSSRSTSASNPPSPRIPSQPTQVRPNFTPNTRPTSNPAVSNKITKPNIQNKDSKFVRPNATKVAKQKTEPPPEPPGHFSCFKKPKESLIPVSEVPEVLRQMSEAKTARSGSTDTKVSSSIQSPICSNREILREPTKTEDKKRNVPMEMLEKLKRQGLLSVIKKPKIDGEQSDSSSSQGNILAVKSGG